MGNTYQRGQYSQGLPGALPKDGPQGGSQGKAQIPTKGKGKTQSAYYSAPYPNLSHSTWQAPEWWSADQAWWDDWSTTQGQHTWGQTWRPNQSQAASSGSYSTGKGSTWSPTLRPTSGYKGTHKGKDPPWASTWHGNS